jgi:hypothetical protein
MNQNHFHESKFMMGKYDKQILQYLLLNSSFMFLFLACLPVNKFMENLCGNKLLLLITLILIKFDEKIHRF